MKRLFTKINCYHYWCITFLAVTQAIPINLDIGDTNLVKLKSSVINGTELENVCVHENAIYTEGQNFSTSNPCETCTCDPPGFSCSLSVCDMKPGCKAIHKANQCCPEYVCECDRNGKKYGNGEKVEEPNPCEVCYCKGGEIKCALVTCYTRDDCEPGYVAGVCCPKYDHCPPLEMAKNKSTTPFPAQVIISDLKTESAFTVKPKEARKTDSQIFHTIKPTTAGPILLTQTEPSVTVSTSTSSFDMTSTHHSGNTTMESTEATTETQETDIYMDSSSTETNDNSESMTGLTEDWMATESATENYYSCEESITVPETGIQTTEFPLNDSSESNVSDLAPWTTEMLPRTTDLDPATGSTEMDYSETVPWKRTELDDFGSDSTITTSVGASINERLMTTTDRYITTDYYSSTLQDITDISSEEYSSVPTSTETTEPSTEGDQYETESTTEFGTTTETGTTVLVETEGKPERNVVKVIVPKTLKKDLDSDQISEPPAPIVVMISAEQIQFLKLAEEPPIYVESGDSGVQKTEQLGVVVVPKTTPTTVEMVKVLSGTPNTDPFKTEVPFPISVNTTHRHNNKRDR